jgi:hypothetical protein
MGIVMIRGCRCSEGLFPVGLSEEEGVLVYLYTYIVGVPICWCIL